MESVNSKTYWDERFRTGDWQAKGGEEQSEFFTRLALEHFPAWLKRELEQNAWSVADLGCADGAGTALLAGHFPLCSVTGVDLSEEAVRQAAERHPNCAFRVGDVTQPQMSADVVFSSNTLEHLLNPGEVLRTWAEAAEKYLILLLPFEDESGIPEHFHSFTVHTFPRALGDAHDLKYAEVLDCRDLEHTCWLGKQILLVYAAAAPEAREVFDFAAVYDAQLGALIEQNHARELALQQRGAQLRALRQQEQELIGQLEQAKASLCRKDEQIAGLEDALRRQDGQIAELEDALSGLRKRSGEQEQDLNVLRRDLASETEQNQALLQLHENMAAAANTALMRVLEISRSFPYRAAHLLVELKHACFGSRSDRSAGWNWLLRDRGSYTKFNYLHELAVRIEQIAASRAELPDKPDAERTPEDDLEILEPIFRDYARDTLIFLPPLVDWNIPLFQRPQQLAMAFADAGILFIYTTPNGLDHVNEPVCLRENCVLIPDRDTELIRQLAIRYKKRVILDICSTDNHHFRRWLDGWKDVDTAILYEYIDEISDAITGNVPKATLRRHEAFLKDERVFVVATADKLYREVVAVRGSDVNTLSSGNGVDLAHFQVEPDAAKIPAPLRRVCADDKPIIGYFGAIANWFDFELLIAAAKARPDYNFLIIGPHYGDHDLPILQDVKKLKNIIMPGTVEYQTLPYVANCFTVATIPFLINDITLSTSPLKLFEYMAMGKPVVTTPMPECKKHPEVLIGATAEEYVACLDAAVALTRADDHEQTRAALIRVAEDNSWRHKAQEIANLLDIQA